MKKGWHAAATHAIAAAAFVTRIATNAVIATAMRHAVIAARATTTGITTGAAPTSPNAATPGADVVAGDARKKDSNRRGRTGVCPSPWSFFIITRDGDSAPS